MSKCCAPVLRREMIQLRASESTSPRCQRNAKVWMMGPFGMRGFCTPHAKIWRKHRALVRDILAL